MDFLYFISPEGKAVRVVEGIRKNINQRPPDRELSGRRHEVDLLESIIIKTGKDFIKRNLIPFL